MDEVRYCGFSRFGGKCDEPAVAYVADPYPGGWAGPACLEHKAALVNEHGWIVLDDLTKPPVETTGDRA